nr:hypothetical protein [Vibrio aerogenes]
MTEISTQKTAKIGLKPDKNSVVRTDKPEKGRKTGLLSRKEEGDFIVERNPVPGYIEQCHIFPPE